MVTAIEHAASSNMMHQTSGGPDGLPVWTSYRGRAIANRLMPRIYRVMLTDADGGPQVGDKACQLGVRLDGAHQDIAADENGQVHPQTGGMSVNPSFETLPKHRVPRRLRARLPGASGNDRNSCFRMNDGPFLGSSLTPQLRLRPNSESHGLVEPAQSMQSADFQRALADTRTAWIVEEG